MSKTLNIARKYIVIGDPVLQRLDKLFQYIQGGHCSRQAVLLLPLTLLQLCLRWRLE